MGRVEDEEGRLVSPLVGSLEKDRGVLVEDPRWQGKAKHHHIVEVSSVC